MQRSTKPQRSLVSGRSAEVRLASTTSPSQTSLDPWSGQANRPIQLCTADEVELALAAAWDARTATAALPPFRRAEILDALAVGVEAHAEQLAQAILHEVGKPITFARGEVARCVITLRFAAGEARRPVGELIALDAVPAGVGRTGLVQRFPVGVVVGITPFNFPLNLVAHKLAPAIAAGCPVIIKPPLQAPTCALILGRLAVDAGWPADAIHVLLADNTLAQRLVEDPRPGALSFTGSAAVGWRLKALSGRKRVTLELGGAAPVVVHRDADLDQAAARVAFGAFAFAGQVCISVQRVIAHRDIVDELRQRLTAAVDTLPWGDPSLDSTISGPLINEEAADRVSAWLSQAIDAGARIVAGGGPRSSPRCGPRLLRPVLLDQVPDGQPVLDQELFGPGLVLQSYDSLDQAAALANAGPWGLQAGVYTQDISTLMTLYRSLEVGGVIHNDVPTFRVDPMPYGGIKDSGLGREGLRYAIAEYTEPRMLVLRE